MILLAMMQGFTHLAMGLCPDFLLSIGRPSSFNCQFRCHWSMVVEDSSVEIEAIADIEEQHIHMPVVMAMA